MKNLIKVVVCLWRAERVARRARRSGAARGAVTLPAETAQRRKISMWKMLPQANLFYFKPNKRIWRNLHILCADKLYSDVSTLLYFLFLCRRSLTRADKYFYFYWI